MKEPTHCAEREWLARQVARKVQDVYNAKADFDRACKSKSDTNPFVLPLADARREERLTIKALEAHRKEHGC
jgi:hypothetical protein